MTSKSNIEKLTQALDGICLKYSLKDSAITKCREIIDNHDAKEIDLDGISNLTIEFKSHSLVFDQASSKEAIIRTRIVLKEGDDVKGYYDLDSNLNGQFIDEWFVIYN